MGNLIKKTAIITALSLIAVAFISVFAIFTFSPSLAGDCCFELGLKNLAISCYEREYKNTGEYDDLVELVNCAIYAEDNQAVVDYGVVMKGRKIEFDGYCKVLDEESESVGYWAYDYYTNGIMQAYISLGDKDGAAKFAVGCAEEKGYTEESALKNAVNMAKNDKALGDSIILAYKNSTKSSFNNFVIFKNEMKEMGYTF